MFIGGVHCIHTWDHTVVLHQMYTWGHTIVLHQMYHLSAVRSGVSFSEEIITGAPAVDWNNFISTFIFQVAAAKVTAEAAQAATAGEINNAAYAVLEAARSIELTLSKQRSQQKITQSKTCNIL